MEEAHERLAAEQVAWLTTISPTGCPQTSPVWFLWDHAAILIASEPHAPKMINTASNAAVSLHLEGADPGALVVTIEGIAEAVNAMPLTAYATKYAEGLARLGTSAEEYLDRFSTTMRVIPARWRVFRGL